MNRILRELRAIATLRGAAALALALIIGGVGGAWLGGVPPGELYDIALRARAPVVTIDSAEHEIERVG